MSSKKADRGVAILGGDGRPLPGTPSGARIFCSSRSGGNGELRRLRRALLSGTIEELIILTRWNGHSSTKLVTRLCRRLSIRVKLVA